MKKVFFSIAGVILALITVQAQDVTLQEILDKHYQASGVEKLQKINTIIMTGQRVQQDIMPVKIIQKRPGLYLMEFDVADLTAYQAFDGETAWTTAPWTGNPAPQQLSGSRATDLKYQADFDGPLYQWKEKGHHLFLEGTDTLDSEISYKIKLIRADSAIQYYYIGAVDFLLQKRVSFRKYQGQEITIENLYDNYQEVEDIPFAFLVETRYPGRSVRTEIETIELNNPVDDSIFSMPSTENPRP